MPSPDEVIPVAFALHNSPRRYALLVGSGISQDAGIPTAGIIVEDLIRQIAELKKKEITGQKPQEWYKETEGTEPTFSGLFGELAGSDDDRIAILRGYFEPSEKNGNAQVTQPTPAHMSIARLVRDGVISVIVTTNFDNLLEKAIEQETGKVPVVITYQSDPRIMEVAGDHCRIVKVNGSYPGTDLKLTPKDLAGYDKNLAEYLNRLFSEYGLLVCGWSGEHDTGLVDLLTNERTRRFAIFWCRQESPGKIPKKIPETITINVHPTVIGITSANEFFGDLESQVALLGRHDRKTPFTVEKAIQRVKEILKESKPELTLSDLVNPEVDKVLDELNREGFVTDTNVNGKTCYLERLEELEKITAPLAAMIATIAYYDNEKYGDIISEVIERLVNVDRKDTFPVGSRTVSYFSGEKLNYVIQQLRYYPALLVVYSSGIAAVNKRNLNSLEAVLLQPSIRETDLDIVNYVPYFKSVNVTSVLGTDQHLIVEFNKERFGVAAYMYEYPYRVIQSIVRPLIPNEIAYEAAFDIFEYLDGICFLYRGGILRTSSVRNPINPLLTRVWVKTVGYGGRGRMMLPHSVRSYILEIHSRAGNSKFFGQDFQRFELCNHDLAEFYETVPPLTRIQTCDIPAGD